jgi:hypothetical protein
MSCIYTNTSTQGDKLGLKALIEEIVIPTWDKLKAVERPSDPKPYNVRKQEAHEYRKSPEDKE